MCRGTTNENLLTHDSRLLELYDDFEDFGAYCAFFCDATAALCTHREEWLDDVSAEGLALFSQWLKGRSHALKQELEAVWKGAGQQHLN